MSNLELIKTAMTGLTEKAYRYRAPENESPPYIVWAEDSASDMVADNKHVETVMGGTIDLYTLQEDDPLTEQIPEELNRLPCAWYLNSVQYEEETRLIHYEWVFEV